MSKKKPGKLSLEDMSYIRQNCFDLSLEDIAETLNRHVDPIRRYVEKENLKARDLTDDEHLLSTLRSRHYYREILKQMCASEIEFFEHQWIDYFKQFNEDVPHTEEMQILEVIRTEVLINRSMEDRQTVMENIKRLDRLIDEELAKPEDHPDPRLQQDGGAIMIYQQQLGSMIGSKSSYINEHEKLLTKKERYLKDLKGTREQRKKVSDDAKTNWGLWLRNIKDKKKREREGFDMGVQSVAADKERARLSDYHEFEDGVVDQPLLNSDTYIGEAEE